MGLQYRFLARLKRAFSVGPPSLNFAGGVKGRRRILVGCLGVWAGVVWRYREINVRSARVRDFIIFGPKHGGGISDAANVSDRI